MKKTKIAIIGHKGKMGQLSHDIISNLDYFEVVAKISKEDDLATILDQTKPDIAIELTSAKSVYSNTKTIIEQNIRPIIGSSGLTKEEMEFFSKKCLEQKLGCLIIPNFSLGIALITNFIKTIPDELNRRSIIEFHHKSKIDKPSGTAKYLADLAAIEANEIASVRSDDFVAKHQLYFSSEHERIIIDHESFDRKSFSLGLELSLKKVLTLDKMIIGLENII